MSVRPPTNIVRLLHRQPRLRIAPRRRTNATHSRPNAPPLEGMPPPLTGVKIIDLTRVLAAPTATMLLADLGYIPVRSISVPSTLNLCILPEQT